MKIGVISDSHGNVEALKEAVAKAPKVDVWMHAGDYVTDADKLGELTGVRILKVAGNGDFDSIVQEDEFYKICGKKIWLTHGHKYHVEWGISELAETADENNVDIVIFGHTHIYLQEEKFGCLFLNPGSVALPRDGKAGSFALIDLTASEYSIKKYMI